MEHLKEATCYDYVTLFPKSKISGRFPMGEKIEDAYSHLSFSVIPEEFRCPSCRGEYTSQEQIIADSANLQKIIPQISLSMFRTLVLELHLPRVCKTVKTSVDFYLWIAYASRVKNMHFAFTQE